MGSAWRTSWARHLAYDLANGLADKMNILLTTGVPSAMCPAHLANDLANDVANGANTLPMALPGAEGQLAGRERRTSS
ncbi:MAG TPA: hypothetical protein VF711_13605 [Acidimicrobiales bacterium]